MLKHHHRPKRRKYYTEEDVRRFLHQTVLPALESIAEELTGHERSAEIEEEPDEVSITVYYEDEEEFYYAVKARTYHKVNYAFPKITLRDNNGDFYHRAVVYTSEGCQDYGILGYEGQQVISNFIYEYDRHLRWHQRKKQKK